MTQNHVTDFRWEGEGGKTSPASLACQRSRPSVLLLILIAAIEIKFVPTTKEESRTSIEGTRQSRLWLCVYAAAYLDEG